MNQGSDRVGPFGLIEWTVRPKKDGLHDSGYRFLRVVGVKRSGERVMLSEWADHVWFRGASSVNIDVLPDGTLRACPLDGGPRDLFLDGPTGFSSVVVVVV